MKIVHIKAAMSVPGVVLPSAGSPPNPSGGEPVKLSNYQAFEAPAAEVSTGVWECTPGQFRRAVMDAEFSHFIAGRATFVTDHGQSFDFAAGDAVFFPPLTKGVWTIHETLRKTYIVWKSSLPAQT